MEAAKYTGGNVKIYKGEVGEQVKRRRSGFATTQFDKPRRLTLRSLI
ncbi:MAG: hypothetical protein WBE44_02125 [Terriglobales bacterium]